MMGFWTPPHARTLPRAAVPTGDLQLGDGRRLRYIQPVPLPWSRDGRVWEGPKRLRIIASLDETAHGDLLHVSLSYPDRDPPWADIRAVRAAFFPATVDVMMVLPRPEDYVNIHPHAFHLWQTPVGWGIQ
jgi:hypothetical protein